MTEKEFVKNKINQKINGLRKGIRHDIYILSKTGYECLNFKLFKLRSISKKYELIEMHKRKLKELGLNE